MKSRLVYQLDTPILLVDIGARGDLEPPWRDFPTGQLEIVGFEPDPGEHQRLVKEFPDRTYHPFAVWKDAGQRKLYLNRNPYTSSMFPPNVELNRQYQDKHWVDRVVVREVEVPCRTLDSLLDRDPDFVKVDTQGAEYEILEGARGILARGAPLVLAETWLREIYKGQKLTHDVLALMDSYGYCVLDHGVAAAWKHRTISSPCAHSKQELIGLDFLFVKKTEKILALNLSEPRLARLCALLELYGFRDYAIHLLEHQDVTVSESFRRETMRTLQTNEKQDRRARLVRRLLPKGTRNLYPLLHH